MGNEIIGMEEAIIRHDNEELNEHIIRFLKCVRIAGRQNFSRSAVQSISRKYFDKISDCEDMGPEKFKIFHAVLYMFYKSSLSKEFFSIVPDDTFVLYSSIDGTTPCRNATCFNAPLGNYYSRFGEDKNFAKGSFEYLVNHYYNIGEIENLNNISLPEDLDFEFKPQWGYGYNCENYIMEKLENMRKERKETDYISKSIIHIKDRYGEWNFNDSVKQYCRDFRDAFFGVRVAFETSSSKERVGQIEYVYEGITSVLKKKGIDEDDLEYNKQRLFKEKHLQDTNPETLFYMLAAFYTICSEEYSLKDVYHIFKPFGVLQKYFSLLPSEFAKIVL